MHVSKFVIHVTKFVTKTILYERKNYLADSKNYLADNENYLADSVARMLSHHKAIVFIQTKHGAFGCKVHKQKRHVKVGLFRMVS